MVKLFEIPIYGLSRKTLGARYKKYCDNFYRKYPDASVESSEICIELEKGSQRCWDYNHIVGYILIYFELNDICFNVYLPKQCDRYRWGSCQKTFIRNIFANSTHFRINDLSNNEAIQKEIADMLDSTISAHVPNRFFVDRETFDNTYKFINYSEMILSETK